MAAPIDLPPLCRLARALAVAVVYLTIAAGSARADVTGKPKAIDGDTIAMGDQRIHLYGIDAPEPDQTCNANGKQWACGRDATYALAYEIDDHWVTCRERGRMENGDLIAVCRAGPYDLGARMVAQGWAMADRRQSTDYVAQEEKARAAAKGIWRGAVVPPWEWRTRHHAKPPAPKPSGTLCVRGELTPDGIECPLFRAVDGRLFSLLGDDWNLAGGTAACVCGTIAEFSTCMQGTPLAVTYAGPATLCPTEPRGR